MDVNRKIVSDFADETGLISEVGSGSTPYCLMRYRSKINPADLCRQVLSKTGALLSSGEYFGSESSFRLCFTLETERLTEAIELLTDFFKTLS